MKSNSEKTSLIKSRQLFQVFLLFLCLWLLPPFNNTYASTPLYGGFLDSATCSTIAGWAWDANNPNTTVSVDIYDGNTYLTTVSAGNFRADLLAAGIGNGNHGFSYTPSFNDGKTHTINAHFSGTTISLSNSPQTTLACGGASTPSYGGFLDSATCSTIAGWAWNANSPSTTVSVDIYDGSTYLTTVSAGNFRADLAAAGIGNGNHGFSYTPSFSDGKTHTIFAYFSGTTTSLGNSPRTTLTCSGASTPSYGGFLDSATCSTIAGWAWNANSPSTTVSVDIYDGSTFLTTLSAGNFRADLAAAGIGNGNHGFSYTPSFNDGKTHTINAYFSGTKTSLSNSPRITGVCGNNTGNNILSLTVNGSTCDATLNAGYINDPCVSVMVCTPWTTTCVPINSILLDTGSYGLRIFKQALNNLPLTQVMTSSGSLAECVQYADGTADWGPVETAGVVLGTEHAVNVPIQVIDSTSFGGSPSACGTAEESPQLSGFNGILGVGPFIQDCGTTCVNSIPIVPMYYTCNGLKCSATTVPLTNQVQNPVALTADYNGLIVEFPNTVAAGGAASLTGSLVLGIGTQSNNSPSGVTTYPLNQNGDFSTTFNNVPYDSFIDTGSNALFFPDTGLVSILKECDCFNGFCWYCPSPTKSFSATIAGFSGTPSGTIISFQIADFDNLISSSNMVFSDDGGTFSGMFDWGLPFFFGKNVFIGFEGTTSSLGTGPYFAY